MSLLQADISIATKDKTERSTVNEPREIFGWVIYDWANSAFYTTVVTVLLNPYLTGLAQQAVGENGKVISIGSYYTITAKSFFPLCVSASVFFQLLLLPLLGAVADYTNLKKRLMALFCYVGAGATCLLFFITGNLYVFGGLLFIIANLCFGAAIMLYNAFLPEIAPHDQQDKVSSWGFALGYFGGGLALIGNLGLVTFAPRIGISEELAVRLSLLSAGLWWGVFSLPTFFFLRSHLRRKSLPAKRNYLTIGLTELIATFKALAKLPHTLKFLIAYLFYNDGIQTVIVMSSGFLAQELFVARGQDVNESLLVGIFLMTQFVAFIGALMFERIAAVVNTKNAILFSLLFWVFVVIYAYGFLSTVGQAWFMGALIALVLGGSQALSRSLFARMIPPKREAAFFSIYEISERGTSWIGPLVFGLVIGATGSYRQAILSLIVFFFAGMIILFLTDTNKAIQDAHKQA